jgi:hypothetical protein
MVFDTNITKDSNATNGLVFVLKLPLILLFLHLRADRFF